MSRRLLLVDDAQDIRAIACLSLERIGDWTVVPAASGQAALEALAGGAPFDAVVLDVMMPGLDGPNTLERMRDGALAPEVPVVFLTAKAGEGERARLLSLGAIGVIAKPFDPLTLSEELRRILDR
jgi:two-component system, OmpR family, response regulator